MNAKSHDAIQNNRTFDSLTSSLDVRTMTGLIGTMTLTPCWPEESNLSTGKSICPQIISRILLFCIGPDWGWNLHRQASFKDVQLFNFEMHRCAPKFFWVIGFIVGFFSFFSFFTVFGLFASDSSRMKTKGLVRFHSPSANAWWLSSTFTSEHLSTVTQFRLPCTVLHKPKCSSNNMQN